MKDLSSIDAFVRVAELRGFTPAARELAMTPSGISRAIGRLERSLGALLFRRTTRSVELTAAGELFYARCRLILADLDEASRSAGDNASTLQGVLRVNVSPRIGRGLLIHRLPDYARRHPGVVLRLSVTEQAGDFGMWPADCAIVTAHLRPDTALARLGTLRTVTLASPAYLAVQGTPEGIDDVAGHRCVVFTAADGAAEPWQFQTANGPRRLHPEAVLGVNHVESLLDAAVAGMGIIQCSSCVAARPMADGLLVPVLQAHSMDGDSVWIVSSPVRGQSAKTASFVRWLADAFSA